MLTIKFLLLVFSVLFGYSIGYIFTETKYRLAKNEFFNRKPFSCLKCLSTHIAWVTSTAASLLFNDWIMLGIGLIFAAALFVGLTLDEKSKTVSINDYDKIVRNE